MDKSRFTIYKHELQDLKNCFQVNIKIGDYLIDKMITKGSDDYSLSICRIEAMQELLKEYCLIIEDHMLIGEDMIFDLEYALLEALIRYIEIVLCVHKADGKLENINGICNEGINNIDAVETIYKRMKLALYMNNKYPA